LAGFQKSALDISVAILWVPFVEETFFRAYIGRSISRSWGVIPGIVIQALVFTLLPSHVAQGMWHMLSIFAFGVLAGWLLHVRRSLWAPWGAHAFANLLPLLVLGIY
jgi:membrane protease YdiL (CAAX protease family)